ncbi:hypothetical protein AA18889_0181 [Acetobacter senegalensis DSM 18889]|nr:hypothetical protein AA18889_0181 [Acetobacter senegalensis DSM 18889]
MPYSLRTEAYSLGILNRIHDGILTSSVQEIRAKRAKDLAAFIEEAFSKDVPNIEKFSIMKEKIELLIDATIAELRPNSSSPFGALNTNPLSIL